MFPMVLAELDRILKTNTLKHIGIKRAVPGFNISIPMLSSLFLIHQREKEITAAAEDPVERYSSETLMDDMMDVGVPAGVDFADTINRMHAESYIGIDENDFYHENRLGAVLVKLFTMIYPTMPGLTMVAYFNQTVDEIESGRKTFELAVEQANKQLQVEGIAVDLTKLKKNYVLGIKKIAMTPAADTSNEKTRDLLSNVIKEREARREKALKLMTKKMADSYYLPVLPLNEQMVKKQINEKFSTNLEVSEIILGDVAMALNILKVANSKSSKKTVGTISHAIMLLGHEELKEVVNRFVSLETIENQAHRQELENNYFSAFMGYRIAVNYLTNSDLKDFEEISICAMIHNFGQIMVLYYYPEAYFEIKGLMEEKQINKRKAARQVIGTTYDNIGVHFARLWGFPFRMIESLQTCYFNRVGKTRDNVLANFPFCATELCAFAGGALDKRQTLRLRELINSLNMFSRQISTLIDQSWSDTVDFSTDHKINLKKKVLSKIAATG